MSWPPVRQGLKAKNGAIIIIRTVLAHSLACLDMCEPSEEIDALTVKVAFSQVATFPPPDVADDCMARINKLVRAWVL